MNCRPQTIHQTDINKIEEGLRYIDRQLIYQQFDKSPETAIELGKIAKEIQHQMDVLTNELVFIAADYSGVKYVHFVSINGDRYCRDPDNKIDYMSQKADVNCPVCLGMKTNKLF